MKILLIEDDSELREPLVFMLETRFEAEVVEASSGNQAIQILSEEEDIDAVICDYNMPNGNGGDVFKFLLGKKPTTPFILCSSDHPDDHPEFKGHVLAGHVQKPFIHESLSRIISELPIAETPKPKADSSYASMAIMPGFCRIRISSLQRMSSLASDLYLKLREDKYIKVANNGDYFEKDDYDRFNSKGIDYLYLPKESADLFLEKLTKEILSVKSAKAKSPAELYKISESVQKVIHRISMDLGFTPEVQALAKANVELAQNTIAANPKLSELLKNISLDKDSYISAHSVALANVACGIAAQMQWPSDNTLFKLALAAFLHDITLTDQNIAKLQSHEIDSLQAIESMRLNSEQVALYKEHPKKAAAIVAHFEGIPPDVDTIVAQHHELPDGKGFPSRLGHSRIFPLACVFIVAHDIVSRFWSDQGRFDLGAFLQQQEGKYSMGYFKKIAMALAMSSSASKMQ